MAYYAKVIDSKVVNIINAEPEFFDDFVDDTPGTWVEAFADANGDATKRYNYCGIGSNYDAQADAFYPQKPYQSWTLNTTTYNWEAPIAEPSDPSYWDEDAYQADNTTGWVAL